jgi:hypothetical protein
MLALELVVTAMFLAMAAMLLVLVVVLFVLLDSLWMEEIVPLVTPALVVNTKLLLVPPLLM